MRKPAIERVLPQRNRTALEGSSERTAVETNQQTIVTTFGHAATKLFELLSPHVDESRIKEIVLRVFPLDMHNQTVEYGQDHVIMMQIDRELKKLFAEPAHQQREKLAESIRSDVSPLEEEAEKNDDKCISVARFCEWLRATRFSEMEELTTDDANQILVNFGYWIGSQHWEQEMEEGELSVETREEKLHVTDIMKLPEAIADWKLDKVSTEAHSRSQQLRAQVQGLFIVTPLVERTVEEKYPIKEGN